MFSILPYHSVVLLTHIPISYINFSDSFREQKSAKYRLLNFIPVTNLMHKFLYS